MFKNFKKRATTVFRKKRATGSTTDLPPEYDSIDPTTSNIPGTNNPPFRFTYSTSTINDTDPRDFGVVPPAPPAPPAPTSPPAPLEPPLTNTGTSHQEEEAPVEEPVTSGEDPPAPDPFARKYVPFVDASPLKNNMLVNAGVYGRVNPAIMEGFGDDSDDDIWLVDDEETDEEQNQNDHEDEAREETPAGTENQVISDSRSETRSHRSARSRRSNVTSHEVPIMLAPSTSQDQVPDAPPPPSARPAFTYNRPALLDDDEFTSFSLTTATTEDTPPRPTTPAVVPRRGYAPLSAAILNLGDLGVDGFDEPPTESPKPRAETARREPENEPPASSSSSVNPSSETPPALVSVVLGTF